MGTFSYDGGPITVPDGDRIVLELLRVDRRDREYFRLHRTIRYADTVTGRTFVVPPDELFETDLASVPQLFTWLVPRSGRHLPAALVHDHLVDLPGDDLSPIEADRVFRDAMGDLDVGLLRRWLMWTAVCLKTIQKRGSWLRRFATFGSLGLVVALGALATVNLATDVTVLPWMGDRGFWPELAFGFAGAVVIPVVLGLALWAPIRTAGVIAGVAVAVLFHAIVVTAAVYGAYTVAERAPRWAQATAGAVGLVAATVVFALAWA